MSPWKYSWRSPEDVVLSVADALFTRLGYFLPSHRRLQEQAKLDIQDLELLHVFVNYDARLFTLLPVQ